MKKRMFYIFLCFLLLLPLFSYADNYNSSIAKLKEDEKNIILDVNNFLKHLSSFKSNFVQYDNVTSTVSEGMFYLSKPMKARFEYNKPNKLLIILNGLIIYYYDIDLDEITTISRKSIPVLDFLSKQQNLEDTDSKIKSVKKIEGKCNIETEVSFGKNEKVTITYIFDKSIKKLVGLNYKSLDGQNDIEMSFIKPETNVKLDKKLFIFQNPRLLKKKK